MVKPLQPHVRHESGSNIQRFERRDSGNMLQSGVAGFGAMQVQMLEFLPVFDRRNALVGDVLSVIEIEIGNADEGS